MVKKLVSENSKYNDNWSDQEKWVYDKLIKGEIADLNVRDDIPLDPKVDDGWPESRILTPIFLKDLLLESKFDNKISHQGVCIKGAWFKENIDLSNAKLINPLRLDFCRFDSITNMAYIKKEYPISLNDSYFSNRVSLASASIIGQLQMKGSMFVDTLNMSGLEVKDLLMVESEFKKEVNLCSAEIGGQLAMKGSRFYDKLDMDRIKVKNYLFMDASRDKQGIEKSAVFEGDVRLLNAHVGGQLSMRSSIFLGNLSMDGIYVGNVLNMSDRGKFNKDVRMIGAEIKGQIIMSGSIFNRELNMQSVQTSYDIYLDARVTEGVQVTGSFVAAVATEVKGCLNLQFAKILGSLLLGGSKLDLLNLEGASIANELKISSAEGESPKWTTEADLSLHNTKVGTLHANKNSWPENVELTGFEYDQIRDLEEINWFKDLFGKQKHYSPQPYEQLASVLRKNGYLAKADEVMFSSKERERSEAANWLRKLWLCFQKISIGYGYYNFRTVCWFLVFLILGIVILQCTGEISKLQAPLGFSYSLDMLLPIIRLDDTHYTIRLSGFARYYFFFHQIMGYTLALFLIAGLSGLTKK